MYQAVTDPKWRRRSVGCSVIKERRSIKANQRNSQEKRIKIVGGNQSIYETIEL